MNSNDSNVYIKRGKRYIPFGRYYNEKYLPDGIWYVHHDEHSMGHTNADHYLSGLYKVGDPEIINIQKICGLHNYTEYILNSQEFHKIMDSGHYSYQELVSKIVALVFDYNERYQKQKENEKNKKDKR